MIRNYLGLKAMNDPYSAPWCLLASAVHFHNLFFSSILHASLRCTSLKTLNNFSIYKKKKTCMLNSTIYKRKNLLRWVGVLKTSLQLTVCTRNKKFTELLAPSYLQLVLGLDITNSRKKTHRQQRWPFSLKTSLRHRWSLWRYSP